MKEKDFRRLTRISTIVNNLNESVSIAKKLKDMNGVVDKFLSEIKIHIDGFTKERKKMLKKHKQYTMYDVFEKIK